MFPYFLNCVTVNQFLFEISSNSNLLWTIKCGKYILFGYFFFYLAKF